MRVVAAVHALRLCGTEKCPFDFATDGDSADSENKARMDLPRYPSFCSDGSFSAPHGCRVVTRSISPARPLPAALFFVYSQVPSR